MGKTFYEVGTPEEAIKKYLQANDALYNNMKNEVLKEMIRTPCKALILVEWLSFEPEPKDLYGLGVYHSGCWKRD